MSVTPSSRVVGMFTEPASADNAVEALHEAGFEDEHISYSTPGASGGFFEDLKSLFTGTNPGADNLIHNLTDIGLSSEQAQYYTDEYNNGNTILVVNAPSREEQVLGILHEYGAYSAHSAGVQFGGAQAAAMAADSVSPSVDATQPSDYASTQTEPADYTSSGVRIQRSSSDLGTQSQFQYQSANDQPLMSQPQDVAAPITPLHDMEDQPTRPITSEYATEPHHASEEVITHEYNVENGTGLADLVTPQHEHESLLAQSPVGTSADQIEDRTAQPTTAAPEYGAIEDQAVQPATSAFEYETAGEPTIHSAATTSEYGTIESEVAEPMATTSQYETVEEHPAQPLTATSEYGMAEDQIVHPATTTSDYEIAGEPAVQPATTTHEYETAADRASYASVTTSEDRTENQMAEPTSVAPEHEIEEGLPYTYTGAGVTNQTAEDHTVSQMADAYSTTEEPLFSQQGIADPEPAIIEQTGQPEAVLTTHDVEAQQVTQDSTVSSEPESVTQEQPILNSTMPPAGADTLDSTVTSNSAVTASQPETVTPAQTNAPVVDYAGKLQSLQQQLQVSQQQLQDAKARLQAAKEHETQIQSTQQQLKAIQDELAATHAELNETHSRIDQY